MVELPARAAELPAHAVELPARAVELPAVPAQRLGLSTETPRLLEDTLHLAVRAGSARVPTAATPRADKQGAIHHAEAPASVEERRVAVVAGQRVAVVAEDRVAAEAGIGNRSFVMFLVDREI